MITIKAVLELIYQFESITGSRPTKISMTNYDYDCIRGQLIGSVTFSGAMPPSSLDYEGNGTIYGLPITLSDRTLLS